MANLQLIGLLVFIAALFGWVTVRYLRLPLTIGTVLLTVILALGLEATAALTPGLHTAAVRIVEQINFVGLILHGMLSLLLFAGAFLLDVKDLYRQKLVVGVLSVFGTLLTAAAMTVLMHWVLAILGVPTDWYACLFLAR